MATTARLPLSAQLWTELFSRFGAAMLPQGAALRIVLPNGSERLIGDAAAPPKSTAVLRVIDTALFAKVVLRSDIGLGEAYMDGAFHTPDLFQLLDLLSQASCGTEAKSKTQQALTLTLTLTLALTLTLTLTLTRVPRTADHLLLRKLFE